MLHVRPVAVDESTARTWLAEPTANLATVLSAVPTSKSPFASNVDGTNAADVNVDIFRSSTAYHIAKTVSVPADATLDIISKSIYLEEGDTLRLTASANSDLEAVCSYEIIA